ncbi:hypothetical protein RR46_06252 [Papilio xuthus]|uniref:Uncharacterized protein n=1 Tax=Papilio xuthus TaxID=66420 RepID=A0A194QCE7_PAPXU|nr:hypothetical protein RR46_06252 [Papilio xuthus]
MYRSAAVNVALVFVLCVTVSYSQMLPNVGTVLYSNDDKTKNKWTRDDIALLQARRYSQHLIPPLDTSDEINEEYIKRLLTYFRDIYKTIKNVSPDPQINDIITTAVSDTLGGYLKQWLLPITKFAFYSGTVSKKSAMRMFSFYDDVRKYLDTDGSSWSAPNVRILKSVAINIAPPPKFTSSSTGTSPCDNLVYYEKDDKGLKIPMPSVTWSNTSSIMFLPLKNQSFMFLNSPESGTVLFQYYDTAKSCLRSIRMADEEEFNKRFQTWLMNTVLPHLNDENLYFGLDSVLCLVNKTKELSKMTDFYEKPAKPKSVHFHFASKKVVIVTIILFLEICWCIPAMIYIKCSKKKERKRGGSSCLHVCISRKEKSMTTESLIEENSMQFNRPSNEGPGGKLFPKLLRYSDLGIQHDPSQKTPCISRTAYPELEEKPCSTKSHVKTDCNTNKKESEYCFDCTSNPTIYTSTSKALRPSIYSTTKKLVAAKTVTLFKNSKTNNYSDIAEKDTDDNRMLCPPRTNYKETPVKFKEPVKYNTFIRPKKSKNITILDKKESNKTVKNDYGNRSMKGHAYNDRAFDRGQSKSKKITLTQKGAKNYTGKPYGGIKLERQEPEIMDVSEITDKNKPEITLNQMSCNRTSELFVVGTSIDIKEAPDINNPNSGNVADKLKKDIMKENLLNMIESEGKLTI